MDLTPPQGGAGHDVDHDDDHAGDHDVDQDLLTWIQIQIIDRRAANGSSAGSCGTPAPRTPASPRLITMMVMMIIRGGGSLGLKLFQD